jgi:hypothetical protein
MGRKVVPVLKRYVINVGEAVKLHVSLTLGLDRGEW